MLLINGILMTNAQASFFGPSFTGLPTPNVFLKQYEFVNSTFPSGAACPDGYDTSAIIPPVKDGNLSSFDQCKARLSASDLPLWCGKDLSGEATATLAAEQAELSLLVPLAGSTTMTLTVAPAELTGIVNLDGSTTAQLNVVNAVLQLIVDMEGSTHAALTATANLTGIAHLEGGEESGGTMSENTVAAAVWARVLAGGATSAEDALLAAGAAGDPWSANLALGGYSDAQAGAIFLHIAKLLRNKTVTDPIAGTITVYDNDGVTILFQAALFEDSTGTTTYRGKGAERRERFE